MNLMNAMSTSVPWLWAKIFPGWNNLPTLVISFILLAVLLDYVKFRKKVPCFPPGPTPLPFIGNLLLIDVKDPYHSIQQLAERFGAAFSLQFGGMDVVFLNGFKMMKSLQEKAEDFAYRPRTPLLNLVGRTKNSGGLIQAPYNAGFKQQKRFLVSTPKNLGMKNETLEKKTSEEVEYLSVEFKSKKGSPFDPQKILTCAVANITFTFICGDRFEYNNKTFLKILHLIEEIVKIFIRVRHQFIIEIPWLSYIPGPHQKLWKLQKEFSAIITEIVNEHKDTRDPIFARDLIDGYLEELEKAEGNPESSFNEQNLRNVILDLFVAGIETTSTSMLWGLLTMLLRPEVQDKIHEEIDAVIGRDKPPMMEDQPKLPYTTAVIHEILRFFSPLPISLPYITYRDVEVDNFVIPKGTKVMTNLASVMKDESMWEKPQQFYPEHFLDADGQFVKHEAFFAFSAGRHACPGESLAKVTLFIFFTSLLQRFNFRSPEGSPRLTEDGQFAMTFAPHPFEICAIPR